MTSSWEDPEVHEQNRKIIEEDNERRACERAAKQEAKTARKEAKASAKAVRKAAKKK